MKLNRRGAIGTMLGGLFAGPSTLKAAAAGYTNMGGVASRAGYEYANKPGGLDFVNSAEREASHNESIIKQYHLAQKQLRGELEDWQKEQLEEYRISTGRDMNVHCLKSVSDNAKEVIHNRRNIEKQKHQWIREAEKTIRNITKNWPNLIFK